MRLNYLNKSPAEEQSKLPPRDGKAKGSLGRVMRRVLLTLAVTATCYVAYGFGRLWAEWRAASQPTAVATQASTGELNSLDAMLPLAGQWSFAQLDWDLRSSIE